MLNLKLKNNSIQQLEKLKTTLQDLKEKVNKAKIEEQYLLKQLKEELDCNSLEEGIELLELLETEKKEFDEKIEVKIKDLMLSLEKEGLI